MPTESFEILEETLEDHPKSEPIYDELSKLIQKSLTSRIKQQFEIGFKKIFYSSIITILPKLYLEENNYTKAIEFYHTLLNEFPEEFSYYKILSELYFRKRDYESASKVLEQLIQIAPYKSEELIQPIQQIVSKIPRHPTLRTLYATVLFKAFKPVEACLEIESLIKYHPRKKTAATTILQKQIQAFPNNPNILYCLSDILIESKLYTESLEYIQALIQNHPSYCDKCLLLMQKIIELYPKHCLALELIGHIYYQQENYPQALHYFNQCIEISTEPDKIGLDTLLNEIIKNPMEPNQPKATLLLAKIHAYSNKYDDALTLIHNLNESEEAINAKLLQSIIYNKTHQYNDAINVLLTLLNKHPFHWDIHHQLNKSFKNKLTQTIHKTVNQNDQSPTEIFEHALNLLPHNEYNRAIEYLQMIPETETNMYNQTQRLIARCYYEQS